MFNVFMIKLDEPNADAHWARLRAVAPDSILIEGISGIYDAHRECARRATTSHFFVVDADNWIIDGFSFQSDFQARDDEVAIWRAKNPVNGLVYGNGGIKLFPANAFCAVNKLGLDMSTKLAPGYRRIPVVASEHRFNTTPLSAWRAAFRECVKLASCLFDTATPIPRHLASWCSRHLATWCSAAKAERNSTWCLRGACDGRDYGAKNAAHPEKLELINNYNWLESRFIERYGIGIARSLGAAEEATFLPS
jgi:hypothetical protein